MGDQFSFGETQQGKPKLIHLNNSYIRYKWRLTPVNREYWKCSITQCTGRATSSERREIIVTQPHTCFTATIDSQVEKARDMLKEVAISDSMAAPSKVISKVKTQFPKEALQFLADDSILSRNIRRWRTPKGIIQPKCRADIVLTEQMTIAINKATFLFNDSNDERRILIFATNADLQELALCNVWALDGTFDIVPTLYTQLLTIHGITDDGWIFPFVTFLKITLGFPT